MFLTVIEWNKINANVRNSASWNVFCQKFFLSFFLIVIEWNKIIANVRHSASCNVFKKVSEGLKFLTRVRFGLKHLANPKLSRNFQYRVNSIYICGQETKVLTHFFFHCSNYHCERQNQTFFLKKTKLIQLT